MSTRVWHARPRAWHSRPRAWSQVHEMGPWLLFAARDPGQSGRPLVPKVTVLTWRSVASEPGATAPGQRVLWSQLFPATVTRREATLRPLPRGPTPATAPPTPRRTLAAVLVPAPGSWYCQQPRFQGRKPRHGTEKDRRGPPAESCCGTVRPTGGGAWLRTELGDRRGRELSGAARGRAVPGGGSGPGFPAQRTWARAPPGGGLGRAQGKKPRQDARIGDPHWGPGRNTCSPQVTCISSGGTRVCALTTPLLRVFLLCPPNWSCRRLQSRAPGLCQQGSEALRTLPFPWQQGHLDNPKAELSASTLLSWSQP